MRRSRRATVALVVAAVTAVGALWTAAPASAVVNEVDKTWLADAHQMNLAAIEAGRSAESRASSEEVRRLGRMLVTDHEKFDVQVVGAAQSATLILPTEPTAVQEQRLKAAENRRGAAYDSTWKAGQISNHRAMSSANDTEIANDTADATVKGLAMTFAPILVSHLGELRDASGTPQHVEAGNGGQAAGGSSVPPWLAGAGVVLLVAAGAITIAGRTRQTAA